MDVTKVTVNLPTDQFEFLEKQAAKEDLTFTDVLWRAVNAEKFFVEQEKLGRKILVEEKNKILRIVERE
uniref:CopG-like RHH_1 or ribbon-helix-helix domain-containing protein, RHH_5 n=1 Tax=Candidatus Kentrum sp. TC TaxID=2126339 RepID=A0A450YFB6_9GAMM|nr:MAG: hypothetical protein BECKTC1821E_GA0114239_100431 [Candidatus Kentron sp. TC]VFK40238.1 MAG: hypothetical protein BECKTC1821D_GA0114238_100915 [Candidatus Kentron sp. TC]VFK54934.1 MAG: hypothetical protein BECKTC1821F_GA0114240_100623 [Candidatus Kentron sp. TC]